MGAELSVVTSVARCAECGDPGAGDVQTTTRAADVYRATVAAVLCRSRRCPSMTDRTRAAATLSVRVADPYNSSANNFHSAIYTCT